LWFDEVEHIRRGQPSEHLRTSDLPAAVRENLSAPREPICGIEMQKPSIMGILNTTPDSFSDGGLHFIHDDALAGAQKMLADGADIIDVGGESTRPGADYVPADVEIRRTVPVIQTLGGIPVSIDTRKASVANAAIAAGAGLFNDVSALGFDPDSLATAARLKVPVCMMHASGDPKTMQDDPQYDNVLLDVYDYLEARVTACETAGISRARIMLDPGIGFGKTEAHNLTLLRGLSLFHGLGCAILLGVSRKRLIGNIGHAADARDRAPGSIALGLGALDQGVQMLRVHDIAATKQAVRLWWAMKG